MPPRRFLLATAAALVLSASIAGLVLGAWGAGSGVAAVGEPRHGDVLVYDVRVDGLVVPEGEAAPRLAFRWNGSGSAVDARGEAVPVDALESFGFGVLSELAFPAGGLVPVVESSAHAEGGFEVRGRDGGSTVRRVEATRVTEAFPNASRVEWCLARAGWQGRGFADLAGAPADALCPGALAGTLRLLGSERVRDLDVVTFAADLARGGTASFALVPGLAYPVRSVVDADGSPRREYALAGFRSVAGAALLAGAPYAERSVDASSLGPVDARGAADGGSGLALTLADAHSAVASALGGARHREWLAAHPDARLLRAQWSVHPDRDAGWGLAFAAADGSTRALAVTLPSGCGDGGGDVVACAEVRDGLGVYVSTASPGQENWGAYRIADPPPHGLTFRAGLKLFESMRRTAEPVSEVELTMGARWEGGSSTAPVLRVSAGRGEATESLLLDLASGRPLRHWWTEDVSVEEYWSAVDADATEAALRAESRARSGPAAFDVPDAVFHATAGAGALALGVAALGGRLPAVAGALFTRLHRGSVLAHPTRARIVGAVRARPGLSASDVAAAAGASEGATAYHLAVLTRERHLARVSTGSATRYFPAGHAPPAALREEALRLDAGALARALGLVRSEPGIRPAELARRLGTSRTRGLEIAARLEAEGLVERRREGRRVLLYARV